MVFESASQRILFVALVVAVIIGPFFLSPAFLMTAFCFIMFTAAFNLLLGYSGLLSFGHAAFFGVGGYIGAWTAVNWHLTPELAMLAGGAVSAVLGLAFGVVAIRCRGLQFAMITLALAQMTYFVCLQARFTGGEDGIQRVPRHDFLGLVQLDGDRQFYWAVAIVFIAVLLGIQRLIHSPFGQVLKGIRENEQRTTSLGYDVNRYKLLIFVISCAIAGLAGAVKALVLGVATLSDVGFAMSGQVVFMALVGGIGTFFGPVVGAVLMAGMANFLASIGGWVTVIQGVVLLICILGFRRGIVGELGYKFKTAL
jgi:branched-chain amino acid transport system permease protein